MPVCLNCYMKSHCLLLRTEVEIDGIDLKCGLVYCLQYFIANDDISNGYQYVCRNNIELSTNSFVSLWDVNYYFQDLFFDDIEYKVDP